MNKLIKHMSESKIFFCMSIIALIIHIFVLFALFFTNLFLLYEFGGYTLLLLGGLIIFVLIIIIIIIFRRMSMTIVLLNLTDILWKRV